ncbi:MAG: hypothetical protein JW742_08495 [Candidatus Aminicenantes bacterium]|nr:hypothetical protein [Candidatus Aminicenantes bacterium]
MNLVMIAYYALSAYLVVILGWSFIKEKKKADDALLYLLVLLPLLLRLLRVK